MPRRGFATGLALLAALPWAAACHGNQNGAGQDAGADLLAPSCGNGVVDPGEPCDDGAQNSNTRPDACRIDCEKPRCGDGVTDTGEACDDGNAWGGDGCTPVCTVESGQLEVEPNDTPAAANAWDGKSVIDGAIHAADRDCFRFDVPDCTSITAKLDACPAPATLTLYAGTDAKATAIATGAAGSITTDTCAALDPLVASGARFVPAGHYAICVDGNLGRPVPFYALSIQLLDAAHASYPYSVDLDEDGNGVPDRCDPDRDGDGVPNASDNCPDTPNGPLTGPLKPTADGFLRQWLAVGPFSGRQSNQDCRPTDDNLVAPSDALAMPTLGDKEQPGEWRVLWSRSDRLDFLPPFGTVNAPREVYVMAWVRSDSARDLTLGIGPDDGARVWWNTQVVLDITACQGTNVDSSTAKVHLDAGWNSLLVKVYDQGGGWGLYARFLDGGKPVTDLEISMAADRTWVSNQADQNGNGVGDVCDPNPR